MPFPATQLLEFQEQGYTILRSVHSAADMAGWRQTQDYLQETTLRSNGKLIRTNPSSVSTLGETPLIRAAHRCSVQSCAQFACTMYLGLPTAAS
jgi:hypothetical protein